MAKRAIIVHGWHGFPEEGWFPWLKKELETKGFEVQVPAMPDAERPRIEAWTKKLSQVVGEVDRETYLVGHSIGCQTILRYLESLSGNQAIGSVVLVAPWMKLTDETYEEEDPKIAKPWIETPIDWNKVRTKATKFTAIFSHNDPYVALEENKKVFSENLGAEIIIEEGKGLRSDGAVGPAGHFSGSDGVTELPSALKAIT